MELGYSDLKQEQLRVVEASVQGRDVFAMLPTGYEKCLCYACVRSASGHEGGYRPNGSIVVAVSSLTAIIKDQVSSKNSTQHLPRLTVTFLYTNNTQ